MWKLIFAILLFAVSHASIVAQPAPLISVPDINARATHLVKPQFPESATAVGGDGSTLPVKVVVDEAGNVISAKCSTTCHPLLREAAELAASASKFGPLMRNGKAEKYEGILLYNFVREKIYWSRFGTALESVRQFDNISAGPVAQMLPPEFAEEKKKLLSLDEEGVDFETRQKGIRFVEASLKEKLKDVDLWRFAASMALRRVSFWTMAGEQTDRKALQEAIDSLPGHLKSAPEGIPPTTRSAIESLSKYKVSAELPERELRKALMEMTRDIRLEWQ
jgi:hypothetical protein